MKYIVSIVVAFLLVGCKSSKTTVDKKVQNDNEITFKLIQLNDVYEIAPLSGGKYGGMARVAHVVDSIKKKEPNTYLFMAGDFLNPSLLGSIKYEGERLRGRQMIDVMNAMDFELATFGNHEFDIDSKDLQRRMNESNFYWTSANVFENTPEGPRSFRFVRQGDTIPVPETYTINMVDKDSTAIEVGFFSVTLPSNPREYVHYADIFLEARSAYVNLEMQRVDLIVGLTHLSVEDDIKLAEELPNVSLIMGGHEHNNMLVPTNNATVAKADANAKSIYVHSFKYNKISEEFNIDSYLMPIDDKIASHPAVQAKIDRWQAVLNTEIKQVVEDPYEQIYFANPPLDGTDSAGRSLQTNLGGIISGAMAVSFDEEVDAAIVNGGSMRIDDMLSDEISSIDIFRVLPFGGNVLKVKMTGELLIEVLNFGLSARGTGAYLQRHNIDRNAEGFWMIGREEIDSDAVYTIAMSDFLMKGYDIPFLKESHPGVLEVYIPKASEPASDIRKAVIAYMKTLKS